MENMPWGQGGECMTFSYVDSDKQAIIKVVGVGGAGGNAVNNMIESNLQGVTFIVANTDVQALNNSKAQVKLQLGEELTKGLGAGANAQIGKEAAMENTDAIRNALAGSNMVFITAGFGGGTGTGAAPVIADICKEMDILTVAVVTKPFSFEGKKRSRCADDGIESLRQVADTVITIPNDRLRGLASKNAKLIDMFKKADEILLNSVKGITDLIFMPGYVNLDFADVRNTMSKSGMALMGIGIASGENRAIEAAERAIQHPLLEDMSISGAKGVLMNITSTREITLDEMTEASDRIHKEVGDDADIIWGQIFDDTLGDEMRVTVIATGIGAGADMLPGRRKLTALRGRIRDVTPADIDIDYEEPAYMRKQNKLEESEIPETDPIFKLNPQDEFDLDVPTFLRRKAD